jgi:probable F420-dependent oxidoreductase
VKLVALLDFDIDLNGVPELAKRAENNGFSGIWMAEVRRDPFLPLAVAATATRRLLLGTSVAVAFARSPTAVAHTGWDLAGASGGRFVLGLGTQVRAHVERRFAMGWSRSPAAQMRDYIAAVRAVWRAWQSGERLDQRGTQYPISLMTPFFSPQPMPHAAIPIHIAAVGPRMCELAGETADGLIVHPLHSPEYLAQVVRPAVAAGARSAGRDAATVEMTALVFVALDDADRHDVRRDIAFYASTPSYRGLLRLHGWDATAERLSYLARHRRWADMPRLVSDDMVEAFSVSGRWSELAGQLRRRYGGMIDRVALYRPYGRANDEAGWLQVLADLSDPANT